MPTATDYSTTYVYEIICKDESIQQKYIGLTTNFVKRKYEHKRLYQQTETEVYNVMAKNGGFDNWQIRLLAEYNCKDANEACMMLRNHPGYILERNKTKISYCKVCNYECNDKSNFKVHCKTAKHIANSSPTKMELVPTPTPTPTPNLENLVVELIKQNLEQQKQNLEQQKQNQEQKDQMTELIKSNQQLQTQMIEICKRPTTQNNTVNLQFFLNETCKNAMTLDDFVEQLVITEEETLRQASTPYIHL